jgi:hypothetical protein
VGELDLGLRLVFAFGELDPTSSAFDIDLHEELGKAFRDKEPRFYCLLGMGWLRAMGRNGMRWTMYLSKFNIHRLLCYESCSASCFGIVNLAEALSVDIDPRIPS